jgi:hypothetical protein
MATTLTSIDNPVLAQAGLAALKLKNTLIARVNHVYLGSDTQTRSAVRVPYITSIGTASVWSSGASNGYTTNTNTINGVDIVFSEPIFKTLALSPNQANSYNLPYIATTIVPALVESVVEECQKQIEVLFNSTVLPTQFSGSIASFDLVQSGSTIVYGSSSAAPQFTAVSAKFDRQLKSDLKSNNFILASEIVGGTLRNGYPCGDSDVVPAYGMDTYATTADAAVLTPDTILAAARMPLAMPNSTVVAEFVDPSLNFPMLFFQWIGPDGALNFTAATQFNVAAGRTGHGARLKIN